MLFFTLGVAITFSGFTLSACAGLGGSLIIVPAMILAFGTKQGIAIAALLLAYNNVFKVVAYRNTIPFKPSLLIILLTIVGAWIGATVMLRADDVYIDIIVISMMLWVFWSEFSFPNILNRVSSSLLAFLSGCTSGFSGTSGPLKGLAIRKLNLEPLYFVGAASMVSLAGDMTKALVFTSANIFSTDRWLMIATCMAISPIAVYTGKLINRRLGTRLFAGLFWFVMAGYTLRLIFR